MERTGPRPSRLIKPQCGPALREDVGGVPHHAQCRTQSSRVLRRRAKASHAAEKRLESVACTLGLFLCDLVRIVQPRLVVSLFDLLKPSIAGLLAREYQRSNFRPELSDGLWNYAGCGYFRFYARNSSFGSLFLFVEFSRWRQRDTRERVFERQCWTFRLGAWVVPFGLAIVFLAAYF